MLTSPKPGKICTEDAALTDDTIEPHGMMTTTPADDEFWKRQFELAGNTRAWWFDRANALHTAADVLDGFSGTIDEELRQGSGERKVTRHQYERLNVQGVSPMLRAMAMECLLKALWLQHCGPLAKDGKYSGPTHHRLNELAKTISEKSNLQFSDRELELLKIVSRWIFSGRYPIPGKADALAARQVWRGDPFKELGALRKKLEAAIGIEMRFEG
jgi:hypothetical protein